MILNYDPTDCFTPEEEAAQDAREAERQEHDWLASWADDFHSDEWLAAVDVTSLSRGYVQSGGRRDIHSD